MKILNKFAKILRKQTNNIFHHFMYIHFKHERVEREREWERESNDVFLLVIDVFVEFKTSRETS